MTTPPTTLALEYLFQQVSARFTAENINASNMFGWRAPAQHAYANRISWVPGDSGASVGKMVSAMYPGTFPRPLGTMLELFTVYIEAQDPSDPENELLQYHITRMLRDAWFRAAYLAAHGTFTIVSETWITSKLERRFGASLRLVCELQSPVVDAPPDPPLISAFSPSETVDAHQVAKDEDTTLGAEVTTQLEQTDDGDVSLPPGSIPDDE